MHSGCGETHTHVRETMHTQVTINVRLQPYKKTPARPSPTTSNRATPTMSPKPSSISILTYKKHTRWRKKEEFLCAANGKLEGSCDA